MAVRSAKRAMLESRTFIPTGGVNYGNAPVDLSDQELSRSQNGYYPKSSNRWTVRPGFSAVTSSGGGLAAAILEMVPHYDGTNQYLIAASGGKLYQMTQTVLEGGTPAWTEIGSLTDSTTKPQMLTYNGRLVVADGGSALRYWDGSTWGTVTNSPAGATALAVARGRLISNTSSSLDGVELSAPQFATDWAAGSASLSIKAGWGDGMPVNGFAVGPGGLDVIISKRNADQNTAQLRRLDMSDATPTNWYVSDPTSSDSGSQNPHGIINCFGRTFYFDDVGIQAVVPTDAYDQVRTDSKFGKRINKAFQGLGVVEELTFLPTLGALMVLIQNHPQQYLWFPRNDGWCPWRLGGLVTKTFCTINDTIYFGTSDGNVYKMTENISTDEVTPGDTPLPIQSYGRTRKVVSGGSDMLVKSATIAMVPIKSGTLAVRVLENNESDYSTFKEFDVEDGGTLLADATGLLADATGLLGDVGAKPRQATARGLMRSNGFQIEWFGSGARYEINHVTAGIAGPLGG